MPRYPNDEPLINDGNVKPVITKKMCNDIRCYDCNAKDICIMLSTFLCIVFIIVGLTIINIYFIKKEDGSLG